MKLTDIVCPNCTAPLSVEKRGSYLVCPYCGSRVSLEGVTFDCGPNLELAEKIKHTIYDLKVIDRLELSIERIQSDPLPEPSKRKRTGMWVIFVCILLILFKINVWLGLISACAGGYYLYRLGQKEKQKQESEKNAREDELRNLKEELHEIEDAGFELTLPDKYMRIHILEEFHTIVLSERAYTLKQTIRCYEDDLHKKEMARLKKEQIKVQKEQVEAQKKQIEMNSDSVKCPYCGSRDIQMVKKGFGVGKAVAGAVLLGPVGILGGAIGSNKMQRVCVSCGRKF